MTQATGSPAFVQNQSDPRYSQFLKKWAGLSGNGANLLVQVFRCRGTDKRGWPVCPC